MSQTIQTPVEQPSIGPFKALGMLFGMIGTAINAGNKVILTADKGIDIIYTNVGKGGDAIDIVVNGALADFANDELVNDAKRKIKRVTAEAEAKAITDSLKAK